MKRIRLLAVSALLFSSSAAFAAADQPNVAVDLFKVLGGLILVLAMMAGAAWLLKRFGLAKAASGSTIKIVGGVSVGNRERVLVLEVADQWIVVGVAPGRVSSIATLPRQEQETIVTNSKVANATNGPAANNFAAWLKQTMEKRNAS
jgi:flagellar protein FliO/FliZ